VPRRGVTGYIASGAFNLSVWHVHNLGYFGITPKVSERTLNETADVVDLVNRLLAGDGHQNPGLDCGEDRAVLDQLYLCQFTKRFPVEERQTCFSACKVAGSGASQ
jgi:hypothetical protein